MLSPNLKTGMLGLGAAASASSDVCCGNNDIEEKHHPQSNIPPLSTTSASLKVGHVLRLPV